MVIKKFFAILLIAQLFTANIFAMQSEDINSLANQQLLFYAVATQNLPEVNRMLQTGINPNFAINNITPLFRATTFNNPEIVQRLLQAGADPNIGGTVQFLGATTPLLYSTGPFVMAVPFGMSANDPNNPNVKRQRIIELLLNSPRINFSQRDALGNTVLHQIVNSPHSQYLDQILNNPTTDINAQNNAGNTPLMLIISGLSTEQNKKPRVQKLLQHRSINLNIANNEGLTALDLAQKFKGKILAKMLIEAGATASGPAPEKTQKTKKTKAERGHPYGQTGAFPSGGLPRPSAQFPSGAIPAGGIPPFTWGPPPPPPTSQTPEQQFFDAIKRNDVSTAQMLLQQMGVNPNARDKDGITALKIAIHENANQIVRLLLSLPQTDLNATMGKDKYTALHSAVNRGKLEALQLLLSYPNINVNIPDALGITPLDQVYKSPSLAINPQLRTIITQLLRSRGAKTGAELRGGIPGGQPPRPPRPPKMREDFGPEVYALLEVPVNASPYAILRVDPNASDEEVKKAYRAGLLKWHPDKNLGIEKEAGEVTKLLANAIDQIERLRKRPIR